MIQEHPEILPATGWRRAHAATAIALRADSPGLPDAIAAVVRKAEDAAAESDRLLLAATAARIEAVIAAQEDQLRRLREAAATGAGGAGGFEKAGRSADAVRSAAGEVRKLARTYAALMARLEEDRGR